METITRDKALEVPFEGDLVEAMYNALLKADAVALPEPYLDSRSARIVEAVAVAAEGLGYSPLEVALAWVRDAPGVTTSLIGARTGAQLRGVLKSEEISLPDIVRSALNDVSA